jgi:hypothetical protein
MAQTHRPHRVAEQRAGPASQTNELTKRTGDVAIPSACGFSPVGRSMRLTSRTRRRSWRRPGRPTPQPVPRPAPSVSSPVSGRSSTRPGCAHDRLAADGGGGDGPRGTPRRPVRPGGPALRRSCNDPFVWGSPKLPSGRHAGPLAPERARAQGVSAGTSLIPFEYASRPWGNSWGMARVTRTSGSSNGGTDPRIAGGSTGSLGSAT